MPLVTKQPTSYQNGTDVISFIDVAETTSKTYRFSKVQEEIDVTNLWYASFTVSGQTVKPGQSVKLTDVSSFDIVSAVGVQPFSVTAWCWNEDAIPRGGSGEGSPDDTVFTISKPFAYVMNDAPIPVVSDGIPFGVGQVIDNTTAGNMFATPHHPMSYVNGIDADSLKNFQRVSHTGLGIIGIRTGAGIWAMPNQGITDVKRFGYPGVSCISGRVSPNTSNTGAWNRITQRWYAVPGVQNALYCEIEVTRDPSATGDTKYWSGTTDGTAGSEPNLVWAAYTRYNQGGTGVLAQYDAALDGISFRGPDATEDAGWLFVRPVNHKTTGHYFSTNAEVNLHFSTGVLPTGVDSLDLSALIAPGDYQVYLSSVLKGNYRQTSVFRFVIGRGFTAEDAKQATVNAPNTGSDAVIEHWKAKLSALPTPSGLTLDEQSAWKYYMYTLTFNARSNTNHQPDRQAYDGTKRRILFASLGRWQGAWTADTGQGIIAMAGIDPELVKDNLDYFLNVCMDPVTGFIRGDSGAWGSGSGTTRSGNWWVQNGELYFGRSAYRYLKETNDRSFIDPLYPKLKRMFQFWVETAGYQHPAWGTGVYLLTGKQDVEVGEDSPITPGRVAPKGDLVTTCLAYDFCVQLSSLATAIGQSQSEVDFWNLWAQRFKSSMQTHCWNPSLNWYTAVGVSGVGGDTTPFDKITFHGFYALWAGVATTAQAEAMKNIIMDSAIMRGTYGMRTMDKRAAGYNPGNWANGGGRPQHDGALAMGLLRYGFKTEAETVINIWTALQRKYGTTPEAVNPDTGVVGYAKFMTMGAGNIIEALLMKASPVLLHGAGMGTT